MIRPHRCHRVVVIDDRKNPRADGDGLTSQRVRISVAVPAFVVAENQRRDRIRKRNARNDFRADLGVNPNFLEFLRRERTRLRKNVLGNRQLSNVMQKRRGLDRLYFLARNPNRFGEPAGVELHAENVRIAHLIFRVDRPGERFDSGEVQVRRALAVPFGLETPHMDFVGAIRQIDRRQQQRHGPRPDHLQPPRRQAGRAGGDEIVRRRPEKIGFPDGNRRLPGRQRHGSGDQEGVHAEIGQRGGHQRPRDGRQPVAVRGPHQHEDGSGDLHRHDDHRDVEQRLVEWLPRHFVQLTLAEGAGRGDIERRIGPDQDHRREVDGVQHRHRRHTGGERQRDGQASRGE